MLHFVDVLNIIFRRAAEVRVQNSPTMKTQVQKLQLHSAQTGLKHYDNTGPTVRASFINQLSQLESPMKESVDADKIPDEVVQKRRTRAMADSETVLKKAQETLQMDKRNKKESRSRKCKLFFQEREFLMKMFSPLVAEQRSDGCFPGNTWL